VLAEITAAAADYEQSNRTHLMPRQQRQLGHVAAQNRGIRSHVPCRGRPSVNREYSAFGARPDASYQEELTSDRNRKRMQVSA
jgi:hypothetical protein